MIDGDLRVLFRKHIKGGVFTPIETGSVVAGVPDAFYCFPGGKSGWIEYKKCSGDKIKLRPLQVGWIHRHSQLGLSIFIAVRRSDARKGDDSLLLFRGASAMTLASQGLRAAEDAGFLLGRWSGGPGEWAWSEVKTMLLCNCAE